MQIPRAKDDSGKARSDETKWEVTFDLPKNPIGKASLRIAFAGTKAKSWSLKMNDQPIGVLTNCRIRASFTAIPTAATGRKKLFRSTLRR